jgi:multidrug efflux system membrane fusion protein
MRIIWRALAVVAGLGLVAALLWPVFRPAPPVAQQPGPGRRGGEAGAPVPVLAATARMTDVPVLLEGVGTVKALNAVVVRPQVDGQIIEIAFREGQEVARGDVLAQIDPTLYKATLAQVSAKKAQDEAQLANARRDLARYETLVASKSGTVQQLETQRALIAQLEAQIRADQAAIDSATATLGYTTIRAPISGRTGLRQVDVGNLVRAGEASGIVALTQVRPISVIFNLAQQHAPRVMAAMAAGPAPAEALDGEARTVIDRGALGVIDNQIDQTTGSIRLKAEFPNAELKLWPGGFVNVRLTIETLRGVVVAPSAAIQRGPKGAFVYVVDGERAAVRPVVVRQQDETQAVVAEGLAAGERVLTSGFARLSDKARIVIGAEEDKPKPAPQASAGASPPPEAPSRPETAAPATGDPAQQGERRRRRREGGAGQ